MKLFVTGASGFVGGEFCRQFAAEHEILAMARSRDSSEKVAALGVTPVACALGEVSSTDLRGCDAVVHCAARAESYGSWDEFHRVNVLGTTHLLDVARAAGVSRFIHIGTEAGMFHGQDMVDIDESEPYALDSPFYYSRSKALAEQAVLAADDSAAGFAALSVRPCKVWGPGDQTVLKEVAEMHEKGAFVWLNQGQQVTSTTHIDNLLHAIQLALVSDKHGEAYFVVDDQRHTIKEFLTRYLATQGIELTGRNLPSPPLLLAASLIEGAWRLLRLQSKPPMSRMAIAMIRATCTINDQKARRELGYAPVTSFEQGLSAMPKMNF